MTVTEDLQLDCPPATAFDVMADARNEASWNGDVSRAEMITDQPIGEGSRFVTDHGFPLGELETMVTTYERPDRLEFVVTSKRLDLDVSITFTDTGSGTLMHGTYEPKPKGVMAVLFPLLRPMIRRDMHKEHQNFKALCESQT